LSGPALRYRHSLSLESKVLGAPFSINGGADRKADLVDQAGPAFELMIPNSG
jgi:hypothetical protein